jgi:hypothetical protein
MPLRARDNPFATAHVLKVRYRLRGQSWDELMERLEALGHRAAIVGPEGRGKTTLLEDLQPLLEARGFKPAWLRLARDEPPPALDALNQLAASISPRHILLLDGAEQLGWWTWRWLRWRTRHAGGVVVTSHRPGLLPTLLACETDGELLAGILAVLLREPAGRLCPLATTLFQNHHGNLRDALREMYDLQAADGLSDLPTPEARVTSSH